ncbi:hypothetical protein HK101_010986 [Irineochytrium annulatum]|nr:hypothetical protein HK101_010986 [Irineochytrium annulatum]
MGGLYVLVNVAAYATGLWTVIGEEGRIDRTVHGIVAVYAIPAQMALGLFAFGAYMLVEGDSVVSKLWMAAVVALLYQGAVTGSYGLVEGGRF